MARFLNRPLEELDELYDFVGSQVRTNDVDLSTIQLTHDVERAAIALRQRQLAQRAQELSGSGLYTPATPRFTQFVSGSNATGAPATIRQELAPWSFLIDSELTPNDYDLYLTEIAYSIDANVVNGGECAIQRNTFLNTLAPGGQTLYALLSRFNGATGTISSNQSGRALAPAFTAEERISTPIQLFARPSALFPTGWTADRPVISVSVSNNAVVQFGAAFIITPKGIAPVRS